VTDNGRIAGKHAARCVHGVKPLLWLITMVVTRSRVLVPNHSEGVYLMGDKGPGSKGGGKKPKTSTKKAKGAAGKK
jgi:hypothetical protein